MLPESRVYSDINSRSGYTWLGSAWLRLQGGAPLRQYLWFWASATVMLEFIRPSIVMTVVYAVFSNHMLLRALFLGIACIVSVEGPRMIGLSLSALLLLELAVVPSMTVLGVMPQKQPISLGLVQQGLPIVAVLAAFVQLADRPSVRPAYVAAYLGAVIGGVILALSIRYALSQPAVFGLGDETALFMSMAMTLVEGIFVVLPGALLAASWVPALTFYLFRHRHSLPPPLSTAVTMQLESDIRSPPEDVSEDYVRTHVYRDKEWMLIGAVGVLLTMVFASVLGYRSTDEWIAFDMSVRFHLPSPMSALLNSLPWL
jgi:hypothetical protein